MGYDTMAVIGIRADGDRLLEVAEARTMPGVHAILTAADIPGARNHGLLQVFDRPQWQTVRGGGREYVERIVAIPNRHLGDAQRASLVAGEKAVQVGTRLRLVGQIRPGSWEDERGQTRYSIEFVVTGLGDVEILARGKPKADAQSEPVIVGEEAPKPKRKRAA